MEDDEEMNSDTSSPPQNSRITVTVAAAPPQQSLTLALPIQTQKPTSGREDCWSEGATSVLIDAWGERYLELSRGNLKQKHWQEVADIVSSREDYTKTPKTDIQCKNRIDTVKKKYKVEKAKVVSGSQSKWPFFQRIDRLIGSTAKIANSISLPIPIPTPPVGIRSVRVQNQQKQKQIANKKTQMEETSDTFRSDSDSDPDSNDSLPPKRGKPRGKGRGSLGKEEKWGESVRELTKAILKFGEAYEMAERSKLEQMVEMEKQRMKFTKELEMQRMKFFMNTQVEISKMKKGGRRVNHCSNNGNNHNSDNSSS